jgi:hypothetical protein
VRRESFQLWVGNRKLESFTADGICPAATPKASGKQEQEHEPAPAEATPTRPASWLLYFDQYHLTESGRARAIQLARDTLPQILGKGDQAAIVSSGRSLVTVQAATSDLAALLAALTRLEKDVTQFEGFASEEERNIEEILHPHQAGGGSGQPTLDHMLLLVKRFAEEERWRTQRDLARLGMVIGRLADLEPPKAVLYFADTTRRNPGDHYLAFLSSSTVAKAGLASTPQKGSLETQAGLTIGGQLPFDRIVKQAAALGIRFYTVEPQPLQDSSPRVHDAQSTLQSLAAETGGKAFINGVTPKRMVSGIKEDFGCVWLLSFDPQGLAVDTALPVRVDVDVPKVKVRARGQTVIQSAKERVTNRLLAHFAAETDSKASPAARRLRPPCVEGREVLRPPPGGGTSHGDGGRHLGPGRLRGGDGEDRRRDLGPHEGGRIQRRRRAGERGRAEAGTLRAGGGGPRGDDGQGVLLPHGGDLARSRGRARRDRAARGAAARSWCLHAGRADPQERLARPRQGRPAGRLAPHGAGGSGLPVQDGEDALDVTRVLEGASPVEFPPLALDLKDERCGQVRDMIPAKTLGPGRYQYRIVVREKGTVIGTGETSFVVPEG